MNNSDSTIPIAEDPIEKLKTSIFSQAINATPIAFAVLGWITDMTVTEPRIEELHATTDGFVLVRHSDETTARLLCSVIDFVGQVRQLCEELGLTAEQAQRIDGMVRSRLQ